MCCLEISCARLGLAYELENVAGHERNEKDLQTAGLLTGFPTVTPCSTAQLSLVKTLLTPVKNILPGM